MFFPCKNSISQSARSIWAARASGVAEEVADFEIEVWEVGGAAEPIVAGAYVGEGYVVPDVSVVPHSDRFTNKFTNHFWFFLMNSPILHFRLKC